MTTFVLLTVTTNYMIVHNMLLLTNNILPHKTCLKPKDKIFNKGAKKNCFNTWGTITNLTCNKLIMKIV